MIIFWNPVLASPPSTGFFLWGRAAISNIAPYNPPGSNSLPDVQGAIFDYMQLMVIEYVAKSVINFQLKETKTSRTLKGCLQQFKPQQLMMKPVGQRAWKWHMLHTLPNVLMKPDDVMIYEGDQYRVMEKLNYRHYGYLEYHLVQDYEGSGP